MKYLIFSLKKKRKFWSSLVGHWVKDPMLSLLWSGFHSWRGTSTCFGSSVMGSQGWLRHSNDNKSSFCIPLKTN